MKTISRQRVLNIAIALVAITALSSCNRGYGCPTNFSVNDWVIDAVQMVVTTIF